MKRNPVVPYAIIGVLGILAMIILASVGVNQMDEVKGGNEEGAAEEGSGETVSTDPEEIFQNNCSMCHGADLAGTGSAPALNDVGSRLSQADIEGVINNGQGIMPPGIVQGEQVTILAEWLAEKK
ncbi:cytochrome c550 [Salirhabdus sp. Marseille-P4669]|uniref:cytochrome c550 n=1 Tax=Salirhabdus sp. Marseille-P4669 TaxID=2042310 RepID=UPI000C7CE390|nr:cytochrome c [Salirhabdus sp. Marseille-P4669]